MRVEPERPTDDALDIASVGEQPDSPRSELVEHYDRQYASGGFGYEQKRETWTAWVAEHYVREFDLRPGELLLDVGCGDGFWTALFAEAGLTATGVDLSPAGIEAARRSHPEAQFVVGDAESLPFPDGSFDVVFCRAISHLSRRELFTDASARLASEMARLLRPGGLILVSFYTQRDGGGTPDHAWHSVSDLLRLLEPIADPFHVDLAGHYVQIGAQRRDAPRRRRRSRAVSAGGPGATAAPSPPTAAPSTPTAARRVRRVIGRARRALARWRL
jgi:SAM-dependent methyltransferase